MEIINPDSGWRQRAAEPGVRPKLRLVERLFSYPIRPSETVASFVTGSPGNFAHWETLTGNLALGAGRLYALVIRRERRSIACVGG